jgi:hypothetical protein
MKTTKFSDDGDQVQGQGRTKYLKVQICTDNSAFDDDDGELPRIVRELADRLAGGVAEGAIFDVNGNRCGFYCYL